MSHKPDRDDRTAGFERLFRAYYPVVNGYVRRRAEAEVVDDLVNEVFMVAWRRFDRVPQDPRSWLLAVARNVLGTHIRGARRVRALQARLATVTVEWGTADEELTGVDVAAALAELRPKDRETLMLVNWEGLTPTEAARVLGESPAAFRVRLHRARSRFRALLERASAPTAHADRRGPRAGSANVTQEARSV